MKYWKGRTGTSKDGQYGTMEDNGIVPDSDEVTKSEYENAISKVGISTKKDFKYLYKNASTDADKIDVIAQFLKLK